MHSEAEKASRELIDMLTKRFGEDSSKTINAQCGLAETFEAASRYEEAIEIYKDCWHRYAVENINIYIYFLFYFIFISCYIYSADDNF